HRRLRDDGERSDGEHRRAATRDRAREAARRDLVRGAGPRGQAGHDRRGICDEDARGHREERRPVPVYSVIRRRARRTTQKPQNTQSSQKKNGSAFSASSASSALIVVILLAACGKKGPPLPPLVKLPVAPADLA